MTLFQRAEASTFFGREIGIMYMHAHLRYAEALARVGDGRGLLAALALAQPIGMTDRVASARPRQSTCYYSSSDAAFADRYAARDGYRGIFDHTCRSKAAGGSTRPARVCSSSCWCRTCWASARTAREVQHRPGARSRTRRPGRAGAAGSGFAGTCGYSVGRAGHGVVSVRVGGKSLSTARR